MTHSWPYLVASSLGMSAACWMSYGPYRQWAFMPHMLACIAVFTAFMWGYGVKQCPDQKTAYVFGVAWDVVAVLIWMLLPLLVLGVRLSTTSLVGVALVILGGVIVKLGET